MKLLHIITGLTIGGAERSLHSLLAGGLADYAENHVISLSGAGFFGPRIATLGVPVHCLGMPTGRPTLSALYRLAQTVRAIRPDLVQGWMYHGNLAARMARAMATGRPALVWNIRHSLYNLSSEKRGTRLVIQAGKYMSSHPAAILYNSHLAQKHHEAIGYRAEKSHVIPNGFDTGLWKPDQEARVHTRTMLGLDDSSILIGFVARFHPMKDIPTFLRALVPLMAGDPRLHCVVIGRETGPDNPALATYIAALPGDRVHFLGPREDIPLLMPAFDLFCLSSNSEAFPNVLGEAMASGVSCVATDVGDSRLVLGDTGLIVPPADSRALTKAISELLSLDPEKRVELGALARAQIEENFSLKATVQQYISLYDNILDNR